MTAPPSQDPILPGAVIGVLGGGQLGRMFALAARAMGYRIRIFSPEHDAPAAQVADEEIVADYADRDRLRDFARGVAVVTFEFENVPATATAVAEEVTRVRPAGSVLHTTQHRLREKIFLRDHGFPVPPFRWVQSLPQLHEATRALGFPAVLKTAGFGYDGKGQVKLDEHADVEHAWATVGTGECVLESFVDFEKEISVIAARTPSGEFRAFPVFENSHSNHILDFTAAPAAIDPALASSAADIARGILEELRVVGLLTVEMFLTRDRRLLVNELAPRPHNSGHLTIDACETSQFEQQLRAICGLPLGGVRLHGPAAMANLLGNLWTNGEPDWPAALRDPAVKLHLYGKAQPRPARKMGHLTVVGRTADDAIERAAKARQTLTPTKPTAAPLA